MNRNGVIVGAGGHMLWPMQACGSWADSVTLGRARADVVGSGSVVWRAGPVAHRHSTGPPADHTETATQTR